MSKCPGLHCDGCGNGSGPLLPIGLVIAGLVIIGGAASRIEHAVSDVLQALVIIAISLASAGALAAGTAVTVILMRRHRSVALPRARAHAERESYALASPPAQEVLQARVLRRAIDPPRSSLASQAERIIDADTTADRSRSS